MKKTLLILTLLVCMTGIGCTGTDWSKTALVHDGDTAPDFTVEMLSDGEVGGRVTLSELRGKVVLVTFFATWCPTCHAQMQRMQEEIVAKFSGREFVYLPIAREAGFAETKEFAEEFGLTFPMGMDPARTIYAMYATETVPRNFVIGRDGVVRLSSADFNNKILRRIITSIEQTLSE